MVHYLPYDDFCVCENLALSMELLTENKVFKFQNVNIREKVKSVNKK